MYKLLKHTVSVIRSAPNNTASNIQGTRSAVIIDDLKSITSRLVVLLLGDIRASLQRPRNDDTRRAQDGVNSLYSDTFTHIVLALLEIGLIDDVKQIAEDHIHFETLFMVCRHMEGARGVAPAQQLMQSYLGSDRIRCDERGRYSFPNYVYQQ